MTATELKPCPFCGGEAYTATGLKGDGSPWNYVECEVCAASAEPDEWNNRTAPTDFISRDDPALQKLICEAENAIDALDYSASEISELENTLSNYRRSDGFARTASISLKAALAAMRGMIGETK